jgi:hypothetical protein
MIRVLKNMKLCVAMFFIIYINHVSAMELGVDTLNHVPCDLQEWWKVALTSKRMYNMIMNEETYLNHVKLFMKEHHGNNFTCEPSYPYNPTYLCQSTSPDQPIEFTGHPGFKLGDVHPYNCNLTKIIGPIEGQGKDHQITDMMVVENIDGLSPIDYTWTFPPVDVKGFDTLTNYWKEHNTIYTLKFSYEYITKNKAKNLFEHNVALGLCDINHNTTDGKIYKNHYNFQEKSYTNSKTDTNLNTDTIYYTFDFSKSKYYPPEKNNKKKSKK